MQILTTEQYTFWREKAQVLEQDYYGEKVLLLADGTMLKLFRRKTWLSKTAFFTPAKRFATNAKELQRRDIPCPVVIKLYRMKRPYRSVVHYFPLAGNTLRQLLRGGYQTEQEALFKKLAQFITALHDLGVYFRSLHMGNIVLTPNGDLLSRRLRNRNYHHLLRYKEEWATVPEHIQTLFQPT
jgi:tRNA A-37 threonylcarbamoyl transferase component Bud32